MGVGARQERGRNLLQARSFELAAPPLLEQRRVVDRNAGGSCQHLHELLVDVSEHLGRLLVGEVEVAEDAVTHANGDAEEAVHRRMVRGEAHAGRVLADVGQAQRRGIHDQEPEDPESLGERSDASARLVLDADGDELRKAGTGVVEHAQRAVAGVDEGDRGLDDPLEHGRDVEVGTDRQDGVEELAKASRSRMFGWHSVQGTSDRSCREEAQYAGADSRLPPR